MFADMSLTQLLSARTEIDEIIAERQKSARTDALKQIRAIASGVGLDLDEIVRPRRAKAPSTNPTVVHRNPANPDQTWSGRGRKPNWMAESSSSAAQGATF